MRMIFAASAALLLSTAAFAGDDVMAGFYGNTLISKGTGFEAHAHYKADHSVTSDVSSPMGSMTLTGTWNIDGNGQLCRNYTNAPSMMPNPTCIPIAAHKVGDTWQVTAN